MSALQITITAAGLAALANLPNTGTNAVTISHISLTASAFAPTADLTALPGEIKRIDTFGGAAIAADMLHVAIGDYSADAYTLRGFGLHLQDGTLFAVYGNAAPTVILEKSTLAQLLLAVDIQFAQIDATQITLSGNGWSNPPATTDVAGVVRRATLLEHMGSNVGVFPGQPYVTPEGLQVWGNWRLGEGNPSAYIRNALGALNLAQLITATGLSSVCTKAEGHTANGTGINADMLDGIHASEFLQANARGAVNGVASLDASGLVPSAQIPPIALVEVYTAASQAAQLAIAAQRGDVVVRTDENRSYIHNGGTVGTMADWTLLRTPTDAVLSVAGRTGAVTLSTADIGGLQVFVQALIDAALQNYLPKNNPVFTGTMTGPDYNKVP